jgi:hypothetical protein
VAEATTVPVAIGKYVHWNPGFYPQYAPERTEYDIRHAFQKDPRRELGDAFWHLVFSLATLDPSQDPSGSYGSPGKAPLIIPPTRNDRNGYDGTWLYQINPEHRELLVRLYTAMHLALGGAYAAGLERGRGFVVGLLEGTYDADTLSANERPPRR